MKKLLSMAALLASVTLRAQYPPTPDQWYGQLFRDVQLQGVFAEQKTFADCSPKQKPADILYDYGMMKGPGMDLRKFVLTRFTLPDTTPAPWPAAPDAATAIRLSWPLLTRRFDLPRQPAGKQAAVESLLPLPAAAPVPGPGFREVQYGQSYFLMLGLRASGQYSLMEQMLNNFDALIRQYGHVPQGNRSYYLSRSHPPFFCLMVELLAEVKGPALYRRYLPSMEREYAYWMEGAEALPAGEAVHRVVRLPGGELLNRYWDERDSPRPEQFRPDTETAEAAAQELAMRIRVASPEKLKAILDRQRAETCRELRAADCSGWALSSRWLPDTARLSSIRVSEIIPVDLNSLLYSMEQIIARAATLSAQTRKAALFRKRAAARKAALQRYCWSDAQQFFMDYRWTSGTPTGVLTAAGMYPLMLQVASTGQAARAAATLQQQLLTAGGILTSNQPSGLPWDAPWGWAPLQWVAVSALDRYGHQQLAQEISRRWLAINDAVYRRTGRLPEKFRVTDPAAQDNGEEYPQLYGSGCTNGVYLALKHRESEAAKPGSQP